jgi:ribosomal protein L11 methyltransferase
LAEYPALDLTYSPDPSTPALLELLHACLDDFEPLAIHEYETGDGPFDKLRAGWRVVFRVPACRDGALEILNRSFSDCLTSITSVDVPDEDWARRSQSQLKPVHVGGIVVAAPWAVTTAANSGELVVIIQPSMGFGTGHHATTRLCLGLLQKLKLKAARVIDVGTGSGVLAIAAWKLGAAGAVAIDCDPDALQNARENIALNEATRAIEVLHADLSGLQPGEADLAVANLTSSVLHKFAKQLTSLVRPGGHLIVSGFSPDELPGIETAFGYAASETATEDVWAAAIFVNRSKGT